MKAGDDEKKASLWAKECEMMRTLSHPNIVQTFDVPEDIVQSVASSSTLLAMEYCQDGDLRKVLFHILQLHLDSHRLTFIALASETIFFNISDPFFQDVVIVNNEV